MPRSSAPSPAGLPSARTTRPEITQPDAIVISALDVSPAVTETTVYALTPPNRSWNASRRYVVAATSSWKPPAASVSATSVPSTGRAVP